MERYLIFVWGCVEPSLKGPYKSNKARLRAARRLRRKEGDEHGYFGLDVAYGVKCKPSVSVWAFSATLET